MQLKCSPSTIKRYIDRSEALARIEGEVVEQFVDLAESRLVQAINHGNLTAIMFYLKTKGQHRGYTERHQVEGKTAAPWRSGPDWTSRACRPPASGFCRMWCRVYTSLAAAGGARGSAEPPVIQAEEDGAAPSDRTQPEAEVQRI